MLKPPDFRLDERVLQKSLAGERYHILPLSQRFWQSLELAEQYQNCS
jgi:hypothetical protein